jgi:hypothetical protein
MLNASLPHRPEPEQYHVDRSDSRAARVHRLPNEPESRRNADDGEDGDGDRRTRRRCLAGRMRCGRAPPSPNRAVWISSGQERSSRGEMPNEPKSRRNPGDHRQPRSPQRLATTAAASWPRAKRCRAERRTNPRAAAIQANEMATTRTRRRCVRRRWARRVRADMPRGRRRVVELSGTNRVGKLFGRERGPRHCAIRGRWSAR